MARFVHLNGPPGIGKSTLSALLADRVPGTLNLDADKVHQLVGGWRDETVDTWPIAWSVVRAMAATHLDGGRDVVMPQYLARTERIDTFEQLAHEHGASFREVVLLDERAPAIERFHRRARDSDDPWIRHHHLRADPGEMYDKLTAAVRLRPAAVVVPSRARAVRETYDALVVALSRPAGDGRGRR
ncbi:AAA family ATPase [Actinoplanes sp. NPDC049596]|uniref:AAA family ATPase n=1 Tax=unclassified Actinoplanes TaxID=2626549 RepID=UPI003435D759